MDTFAENLSYALFDLRSRDSMAKLHKIPKHANLVPYIKELKLQSDDVTWHQI